MGKKSKRSKSPPPTESKNQISSSQKVFSQKVAELIKDIPDEERKQTMELLVENYHVEKTFTGPLPRPEDFAKYNEVVPGGADRILSMAEREQHIRADGQDKILSNDRRRINGAILLGIALIIVAGIATWHGYIAIAVPLGLSGVVSTLFRQLFDWRNPRAKSKK